MNSSDLCFLTIRELNQLYISRKISVVEVIQAHLKRVDSLDGSLKSYVTLLPEQALEQARAADLSMDKDPSRGPLHGIPYALKDLFYTKGVTTESHSQVLQGYVPSQNATVVNRLNQSGAILLGKQAMGEFAVGNLATDLYDRPRNPWNVNYDTGGSSSGSAVGVAAGLCMGALGTDTGGSIRGPSSYCGVVGLKPTYGRVSRNGVIPLSWSLDHCGPITRTVEDTAFILEAIAGHDPLDPTSSSKSVPHYAGNLDGNVKKLKVGIPRKFFSVPEAAVGKEVLAAFDTALMDLESLGIQFTDIDVPSLSYYRMAHTIIMLSEGFNYHRNNLQKVPANYGDTTWNHLASGGFFTAADYIQAQRIRRIMTNEFNSVLEQVDIIALPAANNTAWTISESSDPVPLEARNLRAPFDMTGMPAITVPCGFGKSGLPIGIQFAGKPFGEDILLNIAYAYEQMAGWTGQHPKL